MKDKLYKFLKTALVYFLGNIFTKILSFILLPLFTNKLDPTEYGEYGLVISIISILVPLVYVGVWDGVFRFAFEEKDISRRHYALNNGFAVMLICTICFSIIVSIVTRIFMWDYAISILVYGIVNAFQYYYSISARALNDSRFFVLSGCISSSIYMIISFFCIGKLGYGTNILYIAYILGTIIQIIILELKDNILCKFRVKDIDWRYIEKLVKFSIPQAISGVMNWFFIGYAQLIISLKLGTYYNGQYNVASKFSSIIILLTNVIQFAWYELAYELASEDDGADKYYKKVSELLVRTSILIYPIVILVIKWIYPFYIGVNYQESLLYIPIIMLSTVFLTLVSFLITIFMAFKDSKSIMVSNIFAAGFNIVTTLVLVKVLAIKGVLISLCLANVLNFIIKQAQLKRFHTLEITFPIRLFVIDLIFLVIFYKVDNLYMWIILLCYLGLIGIMYRKSVIPIFNKILEKIHR